MTGQGTVVSTDFARAKVLIKKQSACSHDCSECSTCIFPEYETTVLNPIGAKIGDRVIIEDEGKKVFAVIFLVYLLPVLLMIASALVSEIYSLGAIRTILLFTLIIAVWIFVIKKANKKIHLEGKIVSVIKD